MEQIDLTGQRFGRLTVLEPAEHAGAGGAFWRCRCDCGNQVDVSERQLITGRKKSCGCLTRPQLKQYIGRQFGDLTVLSYAGKRTGIHMWHCRCVCGREVDVQQTNLQRGHSTSCGCKNDIRDNIHFVNGTNVELIRSSTLFSNNSSGIRGVYWSKKQNRWIAQISFQKKTKYIGAFKTVEEAAEARKRAEERVYGEFLDWYDRQEQ